MTRVTLVAAVCMVFLGAMAGEARADIIWNWSFASESGQFVTDGTTPVAGTYTLLDFSVASSAAGGSIGSLSGGAYTTPIFSTDEPFSFVWDGSQVTQWLQSGLNTFDWWAFGDTTNTNLSYFFGWDTGNINNPNRAALFNDSNFAPLAVGDVLVTPAAVAEVPEPASLVLWSVLSTAGIAAWRRKRKASAVD